MSSALAIQLDEPTREEWLATRKKGIGSSDIAALMGCNPYAGPLDVWLDKTGRQQDGIETRPMRLGKLLEPIILSEFVRETERPAVLSNVLHYHPRVPIAVATPDAFETRDHAGVELKAPGLRQASAWGPSWSDFYPEQYLCQVVWQMAVTGRDSWFLAALLGGQDFRVYHIERDLELEAALIETAERFWVDHVLADRAPAVDGSEAARDYLLSLYPTDRQPLRLATPDEQKLVLDFAGARLRKNQAEADEELLKNQLREAIADAEGIHLPGFFKVTNKGRKGSTSIAWEAIARERGATPEDIARHTTTEPPTRSLRPSGPLFPQKGK